MPNPAVNRQILLVEAPKNKLGPEHFRLVEGPVPLPGEGQVLLRTRYISLDAANRAWMQGATYREAVGAGPIDEGLGLGSEVGKIGGRADYDPVRCGHLLDALIYHVLVLNAPAVLFLFAFEAGFAASQGAYKVHQLRLNPLALQFPEDRCQ